MTLPPLPSPQVSYAKCSWAYTAEQMQSYARDYGQQVRAAALLDAMNATLPYDKVGRVIAAAIRSLK